MAGSGKRSEAPVIPRDWLAGSNGEKRYYSRDWLSGGKVLIPGIGSPVGEKDSQWGPQR